MVKKEGTAIGIKIETSKKLNKWSFNHPLQIGNFGKDSKELRKFEYLFYLKLQGVILKLNNGIDLSF